MARERGFVVEVTAFLPAGETDAAAMATAAFKLEHLADWLHEEGFSAVAVSSKFTSRKVEAAAPDPMPDLDDSAFATISGTPAAEALKGAKFKVTPIGADASAALDPVLAKAQSEINRAVQDELGIRIADSAALDIPAALDRRVPKGG